MSHLEVTLGDTTSKGEDDGVRLGGTEKTGVFPSNTLWILRTDGSARGRFGTSWKPLIGGVSLKRI